MPMFGKILYMVQNCTNHGPCAQAASNLEGGGMQCH